MPASNNASVAVPIFDAVPVHNGVYRVLTEVFTAPWSYHPHYHSEIVDIICLTPGFEGYMTIDGRRHPIQGASVYWVPPNVIHATDFTRCNSSRQIVVLLRTEFLRRALSAFADPSREAVDGMLSKVVIAHGDSAMAMIELASSLADFHAMVEGASTGEPARNAVGDARALLGLWHVALEQMPTDGPTHTEKMPIRKVMDYVQARYAEELSLEEIARECCMSYTHLCRLFKRFTGMTVWTYVNHIRISYAKRFLAGHEKNVTETAYACGFSDPAHFSKLFSRVTGLSPKRWQKQGQMEKAETLGKGRSGR